MDDIRCMAASSVWERESACPDSPNQPEGAVTALSSMIPLFSLISCDDGSRNGFWGSLDRRFTPFSIR